MEASTVFPGFKFSPTDVELISYYLKRKIDGLERSVEVIANVEIYNFEPWDLPDKSIVKSDSEWFFFCARGKSIHMVHSRRATKMGYWKATGKERDVKSGSEVIGTKRTLVFHMGRAPKGERTGWSMHEYCMKGESLDDALVVCRLRKNKEFRICTSQRVPPKPNVAGEKHAVLQNGATSSGSPSDWDSLVDFYPAGESGGKLLTEMAESSENLQVHNEYDFFADILRDEIINLDEAVRTGNTPNEVGLYSIKTVNRARWDVIICVVALVVMLFYLE